MAYDKVVDSAALDSGLGAVADAIRGKSGAVDALAFPEGFVEGIESIPAPVPKGMKIKYIIPCSYTPPRMEDDSGFAEHEVTIGREHTSQLFSVNWELQDTPDTTTQGVWVQHLVWNWCEVSNYPTQHMFTGLQCAHGTAGSAVAAYVNQNVPKTTLTYSISAHQLSGTAGYHRLGQNYRGLLIVTDSTYEGMPMVDESKLTDFLVSDYITAGWG